MTPDVFLKNFKVWAEWCSERTGVLPAVIIAQWADETGWATSEAWLDGHNPAGISPGGAIAKYASNEDGFAAYVETLNLSDYDAVRAAKGWNDQALALGASPWAAGHYELAGGGPGSALVAIIEQNFATVWATPTPAPPAPPKPPAPPAPAPSWDEQAAAHPAYLQAVSDVQAAFGLVMGRWPKTPAEWHQVGTLAAEVADKSSTLGGALVAFCANEGALFRVRLA